MAHTEIFWVKVPCCILTGKSHPPTLEMEAEFSSARFMLAYKTIRNHNPEENNRNTLGYGKSTT